MKKMTEIAGGDIGIVQEIEAQVCFNVFMKCIIAAIICLCITTAGYAQNWPQFRGPQASGISDGRPAPTAWNAKTSQNIKWKTPIPGLAHSSPVVWGDRVFVTTAISSDPQVNFQHGATSGRTVAGNTAKHVWRVYCLEKASGRILWERTAHEGAPKIKRHLKASHANSTPVTDGKHLVASFGSEGLYCYDFNGRPLWKQDLGVLDVGYVGLPEYQWGTASSPIIYQNTVILQCDSRQNSFVAAYDLATGKRVWIAERDELPSWSTPLIYRGKGRAELITISPRFIRGMDPATGKELWKLADYAEVRVPAPIAAHGLIYLSGGAPRGRHFYAVRSLS